jgi:hypothetical protein
MATGTFGEHPLASRGTKPHSQQAAFSSFQQKQQKQLENLRRYQQQQEQFQTRLEDMREKTIQGIHSEYQRAGAASLAAASGGAPQTGMGAKLAVGQQAALTTAQQAKTSELGVENRFMAMQQQSRDKAMQAQERFLEFGAKVDMEKNKKLQDYRSSIQSIINNSRGFFGANEGEVASQIRKIAQDESDPHVKAELEKWASQVESGSWNIQGTASRFLGWG